MHKSHQFEYQLLEWNELNDQQRALLTKAEELTRNAYAPSSKFHVGVVLHCADGSDYCGVNMENASFPLGNCGEASALSAYHTSGNKSPVIQVAIAANSNTVPVDRPVTPCGGCRQLLSELEYRQKQTCEYLFKGADGPVLLMSGIKGLLPLAFEADDFTT